MKHTTKVFVSRREEDMMNDKLEAKTSWLKLSTFQDLACHGKIYQTAHCGASACMRYRNNAEQWTLLCGKFDFSKSIQKLPLTFSDAHARYLGYDSLTALPQFSYQVWRSFHSWTVRCSNEMVDYAVIPNKRATAKPRSNYRIHYLK